MFDLANDSSRLTLPLYSARTAHQNALMPGRILPSFTVCAGLMTLAIVLELQIDKLALYPGFLSQRADPEKAATNQSLHQSEHDVEHEL